MRLRPAHRTLAAALALLALVAGCAAGPDYRQPPVETPAAYKEAAGPWKTAQPQAIDSLHAVAG